MGYSHKKKNILGKEFSDEEETKMLDRIAEEHTVKEWNKLPKEKKLEFINDMYGDDDDETDI